MRIRLRLFLPLTLATLTAVGFLAGAAAAGTPRVLVWGVVAVLVAGAAGAVLARMVVEPLARVRAAALRLPDPDGEIRASTPVTEVRDVVRALRRGAEQVRDRLAGEVAERAAFETLVNAVSEGILQLDADGRIVRINPAAKRLLALPAQSEGRSVGSLVRSAGLRRLLLSAAAGREAEPAEVGLEDRRILVATTPLTGGGAVATLVDLTDLRRLEEVRRDFVANASHELKTPLTAIHGYAETLLTAGPGEPAEPERRQFLEVIHRNAARLQRIVDDLLDLSRLEVGRWEPDLEPLDVVEVATAAWHAFEATAREKNVRFAAAVVRDAGLALADRHALEQVFTNLYDNALRHTTGPGDVRVRVSPAEADGGGGAPIVVEVSDTGSGIPRDALPRIFERFYRVDPARSRAEGGTGLGLSIVRHIIESMGGGVEAESVLRKGTTIRLRLQRQPPADTLAD